VKPLVILGAGGFARETLDTIDALNAVSPTWDVLGFIVDSPYGRVGDLVNDKPILGDFEWLAHHRDVSVICGVGAPEVRLQMVSRSALLGARFASVIHPTTIRTRWLTLGEGVVITAGCVMSNTIHIRDHVHVNPACVIGHDVTIDSFVSLAPGVRVSGNVRIEEGAYLGTGANVIEKKSIGEWSIVGAGSTVVKDVPPNTTVVGVPARVISERPRGWQRANVG